jgi:hypothetical protein
MNAPQTEVNKSWGPGWGVRLLDSAGAATIMRGECTVHFRGRRRRPRK